MILFQLKLCYTTSASVNIAERQLLIQIFSEDLLREESVQVEEVKKRVERVKITENGKYLLFRVLLKRLATLNLNGIERTKLHIAR